MMLRFISLLICFLATLQGTLGAFPLNVAGIDTTRTAVWIYDLRWGVDVVKANIDTSLVPASVMKTVTAASLLNLADVSERFNTPVVAEGRISADSVLEGNVVVRTMGDPTIESRHFQGTRGFADSIAAGLKRLGIARVKGDVVVDQSNFQDATTAHGVMAEDLLWPYGARLFGANWRDNSFNLQLPSKVTVPYVPDLSFKVLSRRGRRVKVDRKDGTETFLISGNTRRGFSDNFAMPDPSKAMKAEIVKTLENAGIKVDGGLIEGAEAEAIIYSHNSPEFGDILRSLMHRSDNLMAEGMLRSIVPGGSRAEAIAEEEAVWTLAGVSPHGVRIVDGSGLSRDNRLTARFLGEVNKHMLNNEFGRDYIDLFPRAGLEGTMKYFLSETPLEGRVAMKTGSMKGVQSYSGYLFDDEGRPSHVLVFIANGFTCSRAALKNSIQRLLLDTFCVSLQNETEQPDRISSEEDI
ncbi:MAG: D-alanyl-D-alanine carboxypeptidase/D-alanyl-D-alanine-endopeptidase [Muribaculaceae bacterium]|nr:D-alanyl-D-alanine carboxypeptidase/D-alanyl-D-alanine-endopeptidase [Muribaculaceae bacterium]